MPNTFQIDLIGDLLHMLSYPFMVHAFEAGTLVAIIAGLIGYLVVLRRSSFAAHALAHSGFAGGAAAVLLGVSPVFGLLGFTSASGAGMALLGRRASERDMETGTVLAFVLGLGLLFVSLYRGGSANEVYSLLFGQILGISTDGVWITFGAFVAIAAIASVVYRPLLFSALDEDVAEAKGMPVAGLNLLFMLLVAIAVSMAIQVVGVLLVFSLTITPAAIAIRISNRPVVAISIAIAVALAATWTGLFVSWFQPYPVSFLITTIVFGAYLVVRSLRWIARGSTPRVDRPTD